LNGEKGENSMKRMTKLQKKIYDKLKKHPEGIVGAVRTNQICRGIKDTFGVGHGSVLYPLYALVKSGHVSATPEFQAFGKTVYRYRAI
jgi:hypothetical protein